MKIGLSFGAALLLSLACAVTPAVAQVPPAASVFPPGFKILSDKQYGPALVAEAGKANDACPKAHSDPGIRIGYSWQPNPAAAQSVAMIAQQPEEPAGQSMGMTRSEPAGKGSHRGGVLTWRKAITPWVGSGTAPDLVLIDGSWVGAVSGGLLGVSVSRFCGTKEAALAWIDGMLDKAVAKKMP